jgi:2-succinyl-5-enolpyruvyl-6-hydroxy-3-cyclohexene-1-carboxylate synthase
MDTKYTDEKNVQILLALLKAHGINQVIASPGSANSPFVASVQYDDYFEVISVVDERSAAYMACGWAHESGKPVVISCTGATASRNYASGLTEAYYRKLPVLAVTSTQPTSRIGHLHAQVVDRSNIQNDVARVSHTLPIIKDSEDVWDCENKVNDAILELSRQGGGPAHLNLQTCSLRTYTTNELPPVRILRRYADTTSCPDLPKGKVAVFVGSHAKWTQDETEALEAFCATNGAIVLCDHASGYRGKYRVLSSLLISQIHREKELCQPDLLIHIGEVSGDYPTLGIGPKEVWRVSPDGMIRDTFRKLTSVFEMEESQFFKYYRNSINCSNPYFEYCSSRLEEIRENLSDLPLSNMWVASQIAEIIPKDSVIHFAILNSLRSWNLFELPDSVESMSNVGGFGIDGCLSCLVGASFADREKLHFCVIGDLAFFYDMNVLGLRDLGPNIRILMINNGKGTEFRQYRHHTSHFEEDADTFIAAAGHNGNKSASLVKNFAESIGFEYLCANTKEEFMQGISEFLQPVVSDKPMLFEVFTDSENEAKALEIIMNSEGDLSDKAKSVAKGFAKQLLGKKGISVIKKAMQR